MIPYSDTDVLIILLSNMGTISGNIQICLEGCVGKKQKFIIVTQLYKARGPNLSAALPVFHALIHDAITTQLFLEIRHYRMVYTIVTAIREENRQF